MFGEEAFIRFICYYYYHPSVDFSLQQFALYATHTKLEKQYATRSTVENTVLGTYQVQYEDETTHDSRNYLRCLV